MNPDLVVRDAEGKVNTVRYEAVNPMLLNEFLKEHPTTARNEGEQQRQINVSYGATQRAGSANPESECAGRGEPNCVASGRHKSLKPRSLQ